MYPAVRVSILALALSGCATMHKSDETPTAYEKDNYECEHDAYAATHGAPTLPAVAMYRDCMHARGYK